MLRPRITAERWKHVVMWTWGVEVVSPAAKPPFPFPDPPPAEPPAPPKDVDPPEWLDLPLLKDVWNRLGAWVMYDVAGTLHERAADPLYLVSRHLAAPEVPRWKRDQGGRGASTLQHPEWVTAHYERYQHQLLPLQDGWLQLGTPTMWWDGILAHMCSVYMGNWNWMCLQDLRSRVKRFIKQVCAVYGGVGVKSACELRHVSTA